MTPRIKRKSSKPADSVDDLKSTVSDSLTEETVVDTRKKGRKPKEPEEEKQYYERIEKIFSNGGTGHKIFVGVKDNQKVDIFTPIGTRVLVARYPDFYKMYLYAYHQIGEPCYPYGGIRVWNEAFGQVQAFYYESVAIHPDGGTKRFHHFKQEIEVDKSSEVDDSKDTKTDEI